MQASRRAAGRERRRHRQVQHRPVALDGDRERPTRRGGDQSPERVDVVERASVDGHDAVPLLQARDRRGTLRITDVADGRMAPEGRQAELRHEVLLEILRVEPGQVERDRAARVRRRAERADAQVDRPVVDAGLQQSPAQVDHRPQRLAVDRDDLERRVDAAVGQQALRVRRREHGARLLDAAHVEDGVEQHREQQVGDRTRGDDRDPLRDVLAVERARQVLGGNRTVDGFAFVEHRDVAAERNQRQHPLGPVASADPLDERPPEADREAQHLDAAGARDPVVTELVEDDQRPESEKECGDGPEDVHRVALEDACSAAPCAFRSGAVA